MCIGRTYIVSKDSTSDFTNLVAAGIEAEEGSTIFVKGGVYEEDFHMEKNLTFIGDPNEKVIVRVPSDSYCGIHKGGTVENITFEYGDDLGDWEEYMKDVDFPLLLANGKTYIQNCKFLNTPYQAGLHVSNDGYAEVFNCEFSNNKTNLLVSENGKIRMTNCIIKNAKENGIFMCENAVGYFNHCKIFDSDQSNVYLKDNVNSTFIYCENSGSKKYAIEKGKEVIYESIATPCHDFRWGWYGTLD